MKTIRLLDKDGKEFTTIRLSETQELPDVLITGVNAHERVFLRVKPGLFASDRYDYKQVSSGFYTGEGTALISRDVGR